MPNVMRCPRVGGGACGGDGGIGGEAGLVGSGVSSAPALIRIGSNRSLVAAH
jgi:hypothetical protein